MVAPVVYSSATACSPRATQITYPGKDESGSVGAGHLDHDPTPPPPNGPAQEIWHNDIIRECVLQWVQHPNGPPRRFCEERISDPPPALADRVVPDYGDRASLARLLTLNSATFRTVIPMLYRTYGELWSQDKDLYQHMKRVGGSKATTSLYAAKVKHLHLPKPVYSVSQVDVVSFRNKYPALEKISVVLLRRGEIDFWIRIPKYYRHEHPPRHRWGQHDVGRVTFEIEIYLRPVDGGVEPPWIRFVDIVSAGWELKVDRCVIRPEGHPSMWRTSSVWIDVPVRSLRDAETKGYKERETNPCFDVIDMQRQTLEREVGPKLVFALDLSHCATLGLFIEDDMFEDYLDSDERPQSRLPWQCSTPNVTVAKMHFHTRPLMTSVRSILPHWPSLHTLDFGAGSAWDLETHLRPTLDSLCLSSPTLRTLDCKFYLNDFADFADGRTSPSFEEREWHATVPSVHAQLRRLTLSIFGCLRRNLNLRPIAAEINASVAVLVPFTCDVEAKPAWKETHHRYNMEPLALAVNQGRKAAVGAFIATQGSARCRRGPARGRGRWRLRAGPGRGTQPRAGSKGT